MISKKTAAIFILSISLSTQLAFASDSENPIYIKDAYQLVIARKNLESDVDKCLATRGLAECYVAEKLLNFLDDCEDYSGGLNQIYDRTTWKSDQEDIKKYVLDFSYKQGRVTGIMMANRMIAEISKD